MDKVCPLIKEWKSIKIWLCKYYVDNGNTHLTYNVYKLILNLFLATCYKFSTRTSIHFKSRASKHSKIDDMGNKLR